MQAVNSERSPKQANLKHKSKARIPEPEFGTEAHARLGSKERSNPSIEGTLSGLRPPSAPHVQR
jgi:hypothetical protein